MTKATSMQMTEVSIESKDMMDIRNKRLNYYNKLLESRRQTNRVESPSIELKMEPDNELGQQTMPMQFLNKFFDETVGAEKPNSANVPAKTNLRKFSASLSVDEATSSVSSARQTSNRRLEEFKRVVENSYNQHVMNRKSDPILNATPTNQAFDLDNKDLRRTPIESDIQSPRNIFRPESVLSSMDSSRLEFQPDILVNNSINRETSKNYEIPYMSAYNVYRNQSESDRILNNSINTDSTVVNESNDLVNQKKTSLQRSQSVNAEEPGSKLLMEKYFDSMQETQEGEIINHATKAKIETNTENSSGVFKKHLSSTGSSMNASPTSQSSLESTNTKNRYGQLKDYTSLAKKQLSENIPLEVKPPETPRTKSASNYRRNLLLNHQSKTNAPPLSHRPLTEDKTNTTEKPSVKTDDLKIFLENKQTSKPIEQRPDKSTNESIENKKTISNKLDHFFANDSRPKQAKQSKQAEANNSKARKPNKNNIFNIINGLEDDENEEDKLVDYSDDDDMNDTFDIFSSQESLVDEEKQPSQFKKSDLMIDLGALSDEETRAEVPHKVDASIFDEDSIIPISNFKAQSVRVEQKKQVKPENIPMLDLMDDDKSQSVAASLAISMCKEIDYQKEMEVIYELQKKKELESAPLETPKSIRQRKHKTQIKLNKLRTNMPLASASFTQRLNSPLGNQQTHQQQMKTTVVKPVANFMGNHERTVPSLLNTKSNNNKEIDFKIAVTTNGQQQALIPLKSDRRSDTPNFLRPKSATKSPLSKSVIFTNQKFKKQSNFSQAQRSHSAQLLQPKEDLKKKLNQKDTKTLDVASTNDSNLFFNFSKLVALESNLQLKNKTDETTITTVLKRPRTAQSRLNIPTVNLNDLDQHTPVTKPPAVPVKIRPEVVKTGIGDQVAYEQAFPEEKHTEEVTEEENDWTELPDEIWLKILFFLKQSDLANFGLTCKKFQMLYLDESLWRTISMKYQYNMCDEWLRWIGKRAPNELNIVQCSGLVSLFAIADMFKEIGPELKVLNLSRCSNGSLSGDNFALQASIRCPNVTSLDLSWTLLSNQTLKLVAESFNRIESINLSGCNMIQEDGFNTLLETHGESLTNLEISGCLHFSSSAVYNIGAYCRNLVRLNISNCHRMTNESVMEACQQWIHLKFIDLRGIKNIKNNCVSTLIRKCVRLEGLSLGECVHLGDTAVSEIATYKSNIKYLDLNGCKKITDNSLRSLSTCSKLEYLNIKATNVTDCGLLSLANNNKSLVELNLSYLPISEKVLAKLIQNVTNLRTLQLYGCYNIKSLDEAKQNITEVNKNLIINI